MKQSKILITGSQGLTGRVIIENLSECFDIRGLDTIIMRDGIPVTEIRSGISLMREKSLDLN